MRASVVHDSVAGSHSSAARTAAFVGGLLKPDAFVPPVTSTLPSANIVALLCLRATAIDATERHAPVPALMSITSAEAIGGSPPPTMKILPTSYMTAEP